MSKNKDINPKHFDVIRSPLVTEKITALSQYNKVGFKVSVKATKKDVKEAVEALFNVKVDKVNIINSAGKVRRFRGVEGRTAKSKKAIVSLAAGQTIDVMGGI